MAQDMQQYTVQDGGRILEFTGVLLAENNSYTQNKRRWIELRLFRTQAGSYVLAAVGRSTVPGEIDRCWVQVSDGPEGVIERLYMYSDNGQRYIPHTSHALLDKAARADTRVRHAYYHQRIA